MRSHKINILNIYSKFYVIWCQSVLLGKKSIKGIIRVLNSNKTFETIHKSDIVLKKMF